MIYSAAGDLHCIPTHKYILVSKSSGNNVSPNLCTYSSNQYSFTQITGDDKMRITWGFDYIFRVFRVHVVYVM